MDQLFVNRMVKRLVLPLLLLLFYGNALAQLERKLVTADPEVELIFHAPRQINLLTVEPLEEKTLHFAIMHTFGPLKEGVRNLYGLDNGANIQFSFEYAFDDRFSLGASRSGRDKFYNLYGRYHLFRQKKSGAVPVSLSLVAAAGVNTVDYTFLREDAPDFSERSSFAFQLLLARKFSNKISVQLSPSLAYFNAPMAAYLMEGEQNLYLALGISGKYKLTGKSSLTLQWMPNLNSDLRSNVGIGIDIEAGGHVFQMYFVTSQALNEQYLLAGGNGVPGEGFRLGFNVNRIFATSSR